MATYAEVMAGSNPSEANGDMKVVPMLEIHVAAESANRPRKAISHRLTSASTISVPMARPKWSYPLNVVSDDKTGQRVTFRHRCAICQPVVGSSPSGAACLAGSGTGRSAL